MLVWEEVKSEMAKKGIFAPSAPYVLRAKVPSGWLVQVSNGTTTGTVGSAFFYPDPEHLWDGSSLP